MIFTLICLVVLAGIIAFIFIGMGSKAGSGHTQAAHDERPHAEKEQMSEPQEEFVDDTPTRGPTGPPPRA